MLKETVTIVVKRALPSLSACLFSALIVHIDLVIFKQCTEKGLVEGAQALVLLLVVSCCFFAAKRRPDLRGGLILAAGLFATMFVRENDQLLDRVYHGFWIVPALTVVAISCALAWRERATVLPSIRKICENRYYPLLSMGFFVTVVFSRIFGMKSIWMLAVGYDDYRPAKHVAEEGCELLGYAILLSWVICFVRSLLRERHGES